jgi:membrane protease YdiL (CAAX protease family)
MDALVDGLRKIFFNSDDELRSGWRVLGFLLTGFVAIILLNGLLQGVATLFPSVGNLLRDHALVASFISQILILTAALAATALCARYLEHRSLASVGFKLHRGWWRDFLLGSALGAMSLALAVGIQAAAGAVSFTRQANDAKQLARGFAITFFFFLIVGAVEELVFRGFAFQALIHNLGPFAAIALTSIFFGLAHVNNKAATLFSTINTMLAGVWLGVAYLQTRSLWLATALHYSWNFVMVFVFGLPVSGFTDYKHLAWLDGQAHAPFWLSGGEYGPEGGAAATVALLISIAVIWKSGWFKASAEMLEAIRHGRPEPPFISIATTETTKPNGLRNKP